MLSKCFILLHKMKRLNGCFPIDPTTFMATNGVNVLTWEEGTPVNLFSPSQVLNIGSSDAFTGAIGGLFSINSSSLLFFFFMYQTISNQERSFSALSLAVYSQHYRTWTETRLPHVAAPKKEKSLLKVCLYTFNAVCRCM